MCSEKTDGRIYNDGGVSRTEFFDGAMPACSSVDLPVNGVGEVSERIVARCHDEAGIEGVDA